MDRRRLSRFARRRVPASKLDGANIGNGSGWRFGMVGANQTLCLAAISAVRESDITVDDSFHDSFTSQVRRLLRGLELRETLPSTSTTKVDGRMLADERNPAGTNGWAASGVLRFNLANEVLAL